MGQGLRGASLGWFLVSGVVGYGFGDLALFQALPRIGPRFTMLLIHCFAVPLGGAAGMGVAGDDAGAARDRVHLRDFFAGCMWR